MNYTCNRFCREPKPGFTLVEVLVVITILGILMTMIMQSYWGLVQTYHKAEIMRQLQRESHFSLARIADRMRNYSLDYEAYETGGTCDTPLIEDFCAGDGSRFIFVGGGLTMEDQPLFSASSVEVVSGRFRFTPEENPFTHLGDSPLQTQPKLMIFLRVQSLIEPSLHFDLQTTISSRTYNAQ